MKSANRGQKNRLARIFHQGLRRDKLRLFPILLLIAFTLTPSLAAVNQQINYQGKLTNSSSVTVADGNYLMKFRLYTSASSATTTAIWEEIRTATGDLAAVTNGLFSVMLGSTTPLTSVNFNQTLYLGVEVCGTSSLAGCDGEMTPRKIIGAVPAAILATAVSGSTTPSSFGTTTPLANTQVTIEATTTAAIPLTIRGASGQTANLFNVQNSAVSPLFFINATGGVFASSTLQVTGAATLYDNLTVNGSLLVNNATSTITNLTVVNATSTNATTTILYASGLSTLSGGLLVNNATSTITNLTMVNATTTNATTTTLYVSGLSTFAGGLLVNNATSTITNLVTVNATTTNATSTNLYLSGRLVVNSTTATSTFSTGGLTVGTSQFVIESGSGRIGIGTTTLTVSSSTLTDKLTLYDGSFRQAPGNPVQVGTLALGTGPSDIAVSGRYAYVVDSGSDDLKVIDVSNSAAPATVSTLAIGTVPRSIAVSGRYAYVVDSGSDDLKIIDVSNSAAPATVSTQALGTSPLDIHVSGRYAYVVDSGSNDLKVIDVSNSADPATVGTLALGIGTIPFGIHVSGRYAYVVDSGSDDLKIIDVSNPAAPATVGTLALGTEPSDIAVSGRYAYVVDSGSDDLKIIDLSGIEATSGIIHSLEAGTLQVRQSAAFDQSVSVLGGLNIGAGGIYVSGPVAVSLASSTATTTISAYFQGNVGLGTTTPFAYLSIQGNNPDGYKQYLFAVASSTAAFATTTLFVINSDGYVGVGTTTLDATFNVDGTWRGRTYVDAGAYTSTQTVTVPTKALIYHLTNNSGTTNSDVVITYNITGLSNTEGAFALIYTFAQKGVTASAVTSTVNIQINGTQVSSVPAPATPGTAASQIFESYVIGYSNGAWHLMSRQSITDLADLAEWIEFEGEEPVAGELVSFGSKSVTVRQSQIVYDPALAGIVSTNPHTVMGTETPTSIKLSLAGRVPVKVSGENGPIIIGDYLTSSSIPGVAMRATRAGRVVGRALEPFAGGGTGQVLALVETGDWPGPRLVEVLEGLETLSSSTTASTKQSQSFVASFFSNLFTRIISWLADATNGIKDLFANTFRAKEKICVGETCINEATLKSLLSNINVEPPPAEEPPAPDDVIIDQEATTTDEIIEEPPVPPVEEPIEEIETPVEEPAPEAESPPEPEPLNDSLGESSGEQSAEQTVVAEPAPEPPPLSDDSPLP